MFSLFIFHRKNKNIIYGTPHRPYAMIKNTTQYEIKNEKFIFLLKVKGEKIFTDEVIFYFFHEMAREIKNETFLSLLSDLNSKFYQCLIYERISSVIVLKEELKFISTEYLEYNSEGDFLSSGSLKLIPSLKRKNSFQVDFNGKILKGDILNAEKILFKYEIKKSSCLPVVIEKRKSGYAFLLGFKLHILKIHIYVNDTIENIFISKGTISKIGKKIFLWEVKNINEMTLLLRANNIAGIFCEFKSDLMSYSNILIKNIKLKRIVESWIGYSIKGKYTYLNE